MVSYDSEYLTQFINSLSPQTLETVNSIVQAKIQPESSPVLRAALQAISTAAMKNLVSMAEAHGEASAVSWAMRQPGVDCKCDEVKAAAASEWDTTLGPFAETGFQQWSEYCAANGKPAPSVEQHVLTQAEFRTQHIAEKRCWLCIDVLNAGRPMFETWREDPLTDEEEAPCGCASPSDFWKPCPHECSVCLKSLTLKDGEGICGDCEENLVTVEKEWPEDSAEAKRYSRYGDGAYHALVLRISANNHREAAHDTDDAEEVCECLAESKRLDARASDLLYKKADSTFEPWWFTSWDYWMQPGSTHSVPPWASDCQTTCTTVNGFHVGICRNPAFAGPAHCAGCNIVNGFHVGICRNPAFAGPAPILSVEEPEAAPKEKVKPKYKHHSWPSPRPKLFAKACAPHKKFKKHEDALEFLAKRARISVEELLEMDPNTYIQYYMGGTSPEYWQKTQQRRYTYYGCY